MDVLLGFQVHGAGGVVQNEDGGPHGQGPGQSDTLLLAAGQAGAPLANEVSEAVGELFHKVHVGHFGVAFHVLLREGAVAIGDVAVHCVGEQEHILGGDADGVAQIVEVIASHKGCRQW